MAWVCGAAFIAVVVVFLVCVMIAIDRNTFLPERHPCGECHIHPGETCDVCGRSNPP